MRTLLLFVGLITISFGPVLAQSSTKKETLTIESFTQNYKAFEGYFKYWYDDNTGKIFLQVDKLGQDFLLFQSITHGVGNGGPEKGQAKSVMVKFIKQGNKIFLLQPSTRYTASGNQDEKKSVQSVFAESVLFGFTPIANSGNSYLIDLTPFLIRDGLGLGKKMNSAVAFLGTESGPTDYRVDESKSAIFLDNTKNFPLNTEFEAMLTYAGNASYQMGALAPDPNNITIHLHQSFVCLPDSNYRPRKFDPRAGFFGNSYYDFSAPMEEPLEKMFILRHRLVKKDSEAAISEPIKPIVYYIDRGAPENVRKALIEGGSWWNQAFESAGYKNAFIVKEMPEGVDPMDIRYNVVNWIDRTGNPLRAYSYGAAYIDPRTGEILKGVVTLGSDRHRQDYLIAEGILQDYEKGKTTSPVMKEMALARIRQLSAHEIGHTLGLYHNFEASVLDRSSVMDYPFPLIKMKNGKPDLSDAYSNGIGSWDKRAILWGYADFGKGVDENQALDKIMSETLAQGFLFIPDMGLPIHPLTNQWDNGKDPIAELNRIMTIRKSLLRSFSEKVIPIGTPMAKIEEALVPIYLLHRYQTEAAIKSLGGLYYTQSLRGDGQTPTTMVAPEQQWKALDALLATITPEALALPEALIAQIPPRPAGYSYNVELFPRNTGLSFDPMGAAETAINASLSALFSPEKIARIIEFNARNPQMPSYDKVIEKVLLATWKNPNTFTGYQAKLQELGNMITLNAILKLAANKKSSLLVKAATLDQINLFKKWLSISHLSNGSKEWALSQIRLFEESPSKFDSESLLSMPPGAPIGMPTQDFLNDFNPMNYDGI